MRNFIFKSVFAIAGLAVAAASSAQGTLWGLSSTNPGVLYKINTATGAATAHVTLTGAGAVSFTGIEILGGRIYATDVINPGTGTWSFGSIDPNTGAYTPLSNQDGATDWHALAGNPVSNLLYTVDQSNGDVLKTVTTGGVSTTIGATGHNIRGLAFDPNTGRLYGIDDDDDLLLVNTTTGVGTVIGNVGVDTNFRPGLAFDPLSNILYLNHAGTNSLYTVNTVTGAATLVGANGVTGIDGLAFEPVPEPATMAALGLGIVALARRRRKK